MQRRQMVVLHTTMMTEARLRRCGCRGGGGATEEDDDRCEISAAEERIRRWQRLIFVITGKNNNYDNL